MCVGGRGGEAIELRMVFSLPLDNFGKFQVILASGSSFLVM